VKPFVGHERERIRSDGGDRGEDLLDAGSADIDEAEIACVDPELEWPVRVAATVIHRDDLLDSGDVRGSDHRLERERSPAPVTPLIGIELPRKPATVAALASPALPKPANDVAPNKVPPVGVRPKVVPLPESAAGPGSASSRCQRCSVLASDA